MGQCNCRKKRKDCQELTDVERAIETVINQFHCYAVKGQKEYLTPNEMQELVVQKLPHLGKCVGPLEEKIECSFCLVGRSLLPLLLGHICAPAPLSTNLLCVPQ